MFKKIAFLSLVVSLNAAADDSEWLTVSAPGKDKWELHKNSLETSALSKDKALSALLQITPVKSDKVEVYKVFVKNTDCVRGYGSIYYNTIDSKYVSHGGFTFDGGSINDAIGTLMCKGGAQNYGIKTYTGTIDWVETSYDKEGENYFYLAHGATYSAVQNKVKTYFALVKQENRKKQTTTYKNYLVTKRICTTGYGKAEVLNLDGSEPYEVDYVRSGSSIGSSIVGSICEKIN